MKHSTITFLLLLLVISVSCKKEQRIEQDLMACTYSAFADKGSSLKSLMGSYEEGLITDKILESKEGKSYVALLERLSLKDTIIPSASFMDLFLIIDPPDQDILSECQQSIIKDTSRYYNSKILYLENAIRAAENREDFDQYLLVKTTADVLDEEDLELPFYKMRVFLLIDLMSKNDVFKI